MIVVIVEGGRELSFMLLAMAINRFSAEGSYALRVKKVELLTRLCARSNDSMSQLDSFLNLDKQNLNKEFTPGYHHSPLGH